MDAPAVLEAQTTLEGHFWLVFWSVMSYELPCRKFKSPDGTLLSDLTVWPSNLQEPVEQGRRAPTTAAG